jgi:predicted transcriptional regulator of viral defense system
MTRKTSAEKAIEIFRQTGGVMTTAQALHTGIHRRTLYSLRESGVLMPMSRGVYRLAELPPVADPDLVAVAARVPKAVIALVSALHFHAITTEIPHAVTIALPRGAARPRLDWPPLDVVWISGLAYSFGVESHERDGVALRVYSAAKAVADCFKFRNRLGVQVAAEALRNGISEGKFTPAEVLRAARVCRVDRVVLPYLEALQ